MAHTDAHAPFHTTDYGRNVPDVSHFVGELAYIPMEYWAYDYTAHDSEWQDAKRHIARDEYRKFAERTQTRRRRNHDRRLMRAITENPDAYDDAVFADHRQDSYAWS